MTRSTRRGASRARAQARQRSPLGKMAAAAHSAPRGPRDRLGHWPTQPPFTKGWPGCPTGNHPRRSGKRSRQRGSPTTAPRTSSSRGWTRSSATSATRMHRCRRCPRPRVGSRAQQRPGRESVGDAGVPILHERFDGPFRRTFAMADPDGYRVTVSERDQVLFWPPRRCRSDGLTDEPLRWSSAGSQRRTRPRLGWRGRARPGARWVS
jgi:hypothetical protein